MEADSITLVDPRLPAVLDALASREFDFRSPQGISADTGLSVDEVNEVLSSNPDLIRRPLFETQEGNVLFTLANRQPKIPERLAQVKSYLAKIGLGRHTTSS